MPFARRMYRGGKVWAEVDAEGRLVSQGGLTRIRYREDDEREYSARSAEIEAVDESRLRRKPKAAPRPQARPRRARLPKDAVVIFTDGACYGNPGPAGIGILLEWKGRKKEVSRFIGPGTNNIAELTAIREALHLVKRRSLPVRLHTDSAYAIGVLTQNWKVKENRELVGEIRSLMESFTDLELIKVRGHSGDERNDRVDQLARDGIDRRAR